MSLKFWFTLGCLLAVIAASGGFYLKGVHDGKATVQARWDAAIARDLKLAGNAREAAEASVAPLSEEERAADRARPAVGVPCRVYDPNDRDCPKGGVRPLR